MRGDRARQPDRGISLFRTSFFNKALWVELEKFGQRGLAILVNRVDLDQIELGWLF